MSFTFIRSALKAATLPAIYCHVKWTYGPRAFRYFVGHISAKSVTSPPIRSRGEYQNVPICYNLPPIGDTCVTACWLFWTLVLISGIVGTLATWVLKFIPFVSTYRLPIQVASIIALVAGVYFQGVIAHEAKWQDKIADLQKQIAEAETKSKETNVVVQEKIVTKTKIIKEKGKDIVNYIDREVVKKEEIIKYIEQCPVPKEIIDLHNQAVDLNKAAEGKK